MGQLIAYTVCTASHLGQARAMADSFSAYNPDFRMIIGLIDKINGRFDTKEFFPHEILEIGNLNIPEFDLMRSRYTLTELSCAVKSFYGEYILDEYKPVQLIYLDTDILVTGSFGEHLDELFTDASIILSPHILKPFPDDGKRPQTNTILNVGLYNGGFFALKNDGIAREFIRWWKTNMAVYCYDNPAEGFFVDQNWLSLVPLLFKSVEIVRHPGYNVAYWNMHERELSVIDGRFFINETHPLVFFHYSGYNYLEPKSISRHQDRFHLQDLLPYQQLFALIKDRLVHNEHSRFLTMSCIYAKQTRWKKFLRR